MVTMDENNNMTNNNSTSNNNNTSSIVVSSSKKNEFQSIFTIKNRKVWSNMEYWEQLCPMVSSSSSQQQQQEQHWEKDGQQKRQRLIEDGYALVDTPFFHDNNNNNDDAIKKMVDQLAMCIQRLERDYGIPATFIFLYDAVWELIRNVVVPTMKLCTHSHNELNYDFLAWYIDPTQHMAGFSPHRDRQPDQISQSFHSNDGQAKYVTMWMALTHAHPENSCLYMIPKQNDPGYMEGDDTTTNDDSNNNNQKDPLTRALNTKESYQNIRAIPRLPGQSVLFTHRIMHWGSRGNPHSSSSSIQPRIAISFVSSDSTFEKPYLKKNTTGTEYNPPFSIRLLLVCAQLLIYHERFQLSKECIRACHEYCKDYQHLLEESYRKKVTIEFVKAMREEEENSSDDDNDDAVLEEMLNAETEGYGEFQDDYESDNNNSNDMNNDDNNDDDEFDDDNGEVSLFGGHIGDDDDDEPNNSNKRPKLP